MFTTGVTIEGRRAVVSTKDFETNPNSYQSETGGEDSEIFRFVFLGLAQINSAMKFKA